MEVAQKYGKEFDLLWDLLVPENGEAKSIQGRLVRAIGRLHHEWWNNGNTNWPESKLYPALVDTIAFYLVPGYRSESEVSSEELEDYAFDYPFDSSTREQIKRDTGFIQLAGLSQDMYLGAVQAAAVLQAALPDEDFDAAFQRVKDRVVEFCRANPELQFYQDEEPSATEIRSVADVFKQ